LRIDADNMLAAHYGKWLDLQNHEADHGDMGFEFKPETFDPHAVALAIWNDIHEPVALAPWNREWKRRFKREKEQIENELKGMALNVAHVGSTAVQGMTAKPIIDILISIADFSRASQCIQPLRKLGYAFIDYPQNQNRLFFRKGNPRDRHLHIVETGSRFHLDMVDFRDALRTLPDLKHKYQALKYASIRKYRRKRARYGEKKYAFIQYGLRRFRNQYLPVQPGVTQEKRTV
jgi:GrpB-like predicted nucleotidyltransferase (UPF0157 family)